MSALKYDISWNYTHRGHHKEPSSRAKGLTLEKVREKLAHLIDVEPRTCRIWIDGKILWYYNSLLFQNEPTEKTVNYIIGVLEEAAIFKE